MLTAIKAFWLKHTLKIYGSLLAVVNVLQSVDLYMSQVLTMKQHTIVAGFTALVSALIAKKGFTSAPAAPAPVPEAPK